MSAYNKEMSPEPDLTEEELAEQAEKDAMWAEYRKANAATKGKSAKKAASSRANLAQFREEKKKAAPPPEPESESATDEDEDDVEGLFLPRGDGPPLITPQAPLPVAEAPGGFPENPKPAKKAPAKRAPAKRAPAKRAKKPPPPTTEELTSSIVQALEAAQRQRDRASLDPPATPRAPQQETKSVAPSAPIPVPRARTSRYHF